MIEHEPMCATEEVTLNHLESEIALWEKSVGYLEKGNDADDEYMHDIYSRHCLQEVLNGFIRQNLPVPDAMNFRIEAADKRFINATFELVEGINMWGNREHYDKTLFWYYYRWPIK